MKELLQPPRYDVTQTSRRVYYGNRKEARVITKQSKGSHKASTKLGDGSEVRTRKGTSPKSQVSNAEARLREGLKSQDNFSW